MRKPGQLDISKYSDLLNNNKKLRLFNKEEKFTLVDKTELLRQFFIKKNNTCIYCSDVIKKNKNKNEKNKCETKLCGLRDVLRHLKHLETITKSVLIYFPEENERIQRQIKREQIPEFNITLEEMENFNEIIKRYQELGNRFGAIKLIPPKGN